MVFSIGYDKVDNQYFVYGMDNAVIYNGSYTQCLVVIGALANEPWLTIDDIRAKCNGYI